MSTGRGAIAGSGEHRLYPEGSGEPSQALQPQRPVGPPGLPGVRCCWVAGSNPCREMEEPCEVGILLRNVPASADAMESLSCRRVPVLRLPVVGGEGRRLIF